jgi:acetyltransferase-like isoleucine patch superfamily enzyme
MGACAKIGNNNFISAYCSIEHHNELHNHSSFGPGVLTSSKVIIKDRVRFGTGIFIEPHITIGEDSIIASGAIITKDIPSNTLIKTQINYIMREKNT